MDYKDIVERSLKTFLEAFFGVFIPAVVVFLNSGWPESWGAVWVALAPVIAAALAAGIAAAWNYIQQVIEQ